jgi:hypothetical protein
MIRGADAAVRTTVRGTIALIHRRPCEGTKAPGDIHTVHRDGNWFNGVEGSTRVQPGHGERNSYGNDPRRSPG